jgi:hypothetical protein
MKPGQTEMPSGPAGGHVSSRLPASAPVAVMTGIRSKGVSPGSKASNLTRTVKLPVVTVSTQFVWSADRHGPGTTRSEAHRNWTPVSASALGTTVRSLWQTAPIPTHDDGAGSAVAGAAIVPVFVAVAVTVVVEVLVPVAMAVIVVVAAEVAAPVGVAVLVAVGVAVSGGTVAGGARTKIVADAVLSDGSTSSSFAATVAVFTRVVPAAAEVACSTRRMLVMAPTARLPSAQVTV